MYLGKRTRKNKYFPRLEIVKFEKKTLLGLFFNKKYVNVKRHCWSQCGHTQKNFSNIFKKHRQLTIFTDICSV
jgi:hypothetical protein